MTSTRRQFLSWSALTVGGAAMAGCGLTGQGTAPSPASTSEATSAESLAALAYWTAQQGANGGSYGIGGALVESATGRVLQTMPNRVFRTLPQAVQAEAGKTFVQDPTAHGERQLMSWYLANRERLGLPEPSALTVVTSVDPCLMCANSIMTAGVNVGVVAPDNYSGVNYDLSGQFADLPEPLRTAATATFGYYAVEGGRAYQGSPSVAYSDQPISNSTYQGCIDLFSSSADTVRAARGTDATAPSALTDPATNPAAIDLVRAFQVVYPGALEVKVKDTRAPDRRVVDALATLVDQTPGATNAVGFLDPFGNLLVAAADQSDVNPLSTAFALCARAYSETRYALVANPATLPLAKQSLTNPNFGTFVFLRAPDPYTPEGMFDVGAYGSTMGSSATPLIPSAFQYVEPPPGVTTRQLQDVMLTLPPLYSQGIKIQPQQVVV